MAEFESYFDKSNPEECWLWKGGTNDYGYGRWCVRGTTPIKRLLAHRESYRRYVGEIPDGMFVCHKCDTPLCVNPNHLFLGDWAINAADRNRKGRQARGERLNLNKLTENQVREIRRLRTEGLTLRAIARRFGVTAENIHSVVQRETWKWVVP